MKTEPGTQARWGRRVHTAGILVGALVAGPPVSGADDHEKLKECAAVHVEFSRSANKIKAATPVPPGWTVGGGLGPSNMLLYR